LNSLSQVVFSSSSKKEINTSSSKKEKATKELLELKQLKDAGVITNVEYIKAAAPLKKIVLGL
tara:strand:- start:28 stop:216 length:189 start_codon:yes stop_codon:yes gene_type:complete